MFIGEIRGLLNDVTDEWSLKISNESNEMINDEVANENDQPANTTNNEREESSQWSDQANNEVANNDGETRNEVRVDVETVKDALFKRPAIERPGGEPNRHVLNLKFNNIDKLTKETDYPLWKDKLVGEIKAKDCEFTISENIQKPTVFDKF